MNDTVIEVQNLSKQYRLGTVGTGTLAHDINRWWHKVRGKEDPYLAIGDTNDRTTKGVSDYVWSLKDINLSVKRGEVVGLIGRNGAGKSTLLKILSRTTSPTTGIVKIRGRLASLLEVGTGFHPELTGRENIFLNGAILGMTTREIKSKFDEIVDFSGVERYVDTPVKRYSSGMYVRLAFAVAAHLESEILIVDEVLAVGDAEFQKKCLGKMGEVSKGQGKTVLFVSHNMASIRQLCTVGTLLENGNVAFHGSIDKATRLYLNSKSLSELGSHYIKHNPENKAIELLEALVLDSNGTQRSQFDAEDEIFIKVKIQKNVHVPKAMGYFVIMNESEEIFIESDTFDFTPNILEYLETGLHWVTLTIPRRVLPNGSFVVYFNFSSEFAVNGFTLDSPQEVLSFEIHDTNTVRGTIRIATTNCIVKWEKTN